MTTHQKDSAITHTCGRDPISKQLARSKQHAIELAARWAEMARGGA